MVDFGAHHDSDDISLILRQILRRSSSSSPPLPPPPSPPLATVGVVAHAEDHLPCLSSLPVRNLYSQIPVRSAVFSCSDRLSADRINDETLNGVVLSSSETMRFFPCSGGSNLSSESLTGSVQMTGLDREYVEECDYGNEEVPEPAMEEPDTKQQSQRSQSKRSRVAEVHNLSEKRRRSRINEKMKALQNLIPNSNKTDKASMLDEAIEYLKQLQLQVQMLSIRNGLSLHAMCFPGVPEILHSAQLPQMGRDLGRRGGSLDVDMTNALNTAPNTSDTMLSMPKQCGSPGRAALPSVSTIINSETTSFGLESCIQPSFSSFELHDQAICRDQRVHQDHYNVNSTEMKAQGYLQQLLVPKMPSS